MIDRGHFDATLRARESDLAPASRRRRQRLTAARRHALTGLRSHRSVAVLQGDVQVGGRLAELRPQL